MQFPVDFVPFEKWIAFKGDFPPKAGEHRIIIIHHDKDNVEYFYVTSYDSEEEKAKINKNNKKDISSVAEILKTDWNEVLTKNSCVQCNLRHRHEVSINELRKDYENGYIKYLGKIPEKVKRTIIIAICASETFDNEEKKIYTT